jgi:hypothetical protein
VLFLRATYFISFKSDEARRRRIKYNSSITSETSGSEKENFTLIHKEGNQIVTTPGRSTLGKYTKGDPALNKNKMKIVIIISFFFFCV